MTTMRDIVTRAYRKIGVVAGDEPMTADQGATGIDTMNAMMHAWKLRGCDIEHTTKTLNDDFPLGPEFEEGTCYLLAARLAPDFAMPVGFDADQWFRDIQAAYTTVAAVTLPKALTLWRRAGREYTF